MDSAQLHLELLDSGERLDMALADARSANVIDTGDLDYTTWQNRMRMAHHEVERAAECYWVALRTYRVVTMAELAPSEPVKSNPPRAIARRRRRVRSMAAVCGNDRDRANRNRRKDVGSERLPASTKLSQIQ